MYTMMHGRKKHKKGTCNFMRVLMTVSKHIQDGTACKRSSELWWNLTVPTVQ